jgi:hypothetical protein
VERPGDGREDGCAAWAARDDAHGHADVRFQVRRLMWESRRTRPLLGDF